MVSGFCTHGNYFTNTVGVVVEIDDSLATPDIAYTRDRLGNVLSAVAAGVSTNLYAYSREGLLTNEVQNGVALSRPHDALGRLTGYTCRSADDPSAIVHHAESAENAESDR